MKILVYGDVHGCLEEFKLLRNIAPIDKVDLEICVGDLIDRGEYDKEVFDYIMENNIKSVIGNHEYRLLRKYNKENISLDKDQQKVFSNLKDIHFEYIKNMPLFYKIDNTTILHAGIDTKINLEKDFDISKFLYFRDLDENGEFLPLIHNNPNAKYWAEVYDAREGFIIHGHQPFSNVTKFRNSIAIDTGCVYGNKLSAVYIKDTKKPWEFEVFSIKAKKEYAKYYKSL